MNKARVLMGERMQGAALVAAGAGRRVADGHAGVVGAVSRSGSAEIRRTGCPRCGGEHPLRSCNKRQAFSGVCWSCKEKGHRAFECPAAAAASGNGMEKESAPAPSPM